MSSKRELSQATVSNSGSEDETSVKKPRNEAKLKKDADGNDYIELGGQKRLTISSVCLFLYALCSLKGKPMSTLGNVRSPLCTLIDYEKDGAYLPGKKGIALPVEAWQIIKDNFSLIDNLLENK